MNQSSGIKPRIFLVEDEQSLVLTITDRLEAEGYEVTHRGDGEEAEALGLASPFDLVVLDVMLPNKNGFDICRNWRAKGMNTPVLMLTAKRDVFDRVVGLKLGADDYLTKPFEMAELSARIEALLRRAHTPVKESAGSYSFADIHVDFAKKEVMKAGEPLAVTALDFKLLQYFIQNRGRAVSRDELLDKVWEYDTDLYTRTVDVHIAGLRRLLEDNPNKPEFIVTVHRVGYKFVG